MYLIAGVSVYRQIVVYEGPLHFFCSFKKTINSSYLIFVRRVIQNNLKMVVVAACLALSSKYSRTMEYNWSAWCQYNVTGWDTILSHVIPVRQHYKEGHWVPLLEIDTSSHRFGHPRCGIKLVQKV